MLFHLGDRVIVSASIGWPNGTTGTVSMPPESLQQIVEDEAPWLGWHRYTQGRERMIESYWVEFDEPRIYGDGDGPYPAAEIPSDYLERVTDP